MSPLLLCLSLAQAADPPTWDIQKTFAAHHEVPLTLSEGTWMSVSVHGDQLVFDLLGDIWSLPLAGGQARRLTSGLAWDTEPRYSPDGSEIAYVSDADGNEQLWVMKADGTGARKLTQESEARVTDPVWDPRGEWVVGRRRTVDTRSIGVTELWQYHVQGGAGFALTSLDSYPHAGESAFSPAGNLLYFSNRYGRFNYDQDPVGGLWSIERMDRRTGEVQSLIYGSGSAVRPLPSPDGRTVAFVSRDRSRTLLELLDLETGRRRVLADWLDHDQMEGFALHGVYPAMDWTEDGRSLVLWAGGKLWRLGLDGKRAEIPFTAQGSWVQHDVSRAQRRIPDEVQARVLRWPVKNAAGQIALSAMGQLWLVEPDGAARRLSEGTGYAPAWSPDGKALAWTSWKDCPAGASFEDPCGGALHITRGKKTETLPVRGQLLNPAWTEDGRLYVLRGVGGVTSPDLGAEPRYELMLLSPEGKGWKARKVSELSNRGSASRAPRLYPHQGRIYYLEDQPGADRSPTTTALVSIQPDGTDKRTHVKVGGAEELVPSPDFKRLAYKLEHQVHVAPFDPFARDVTLLDAAPHRALTEISGDWLSWSPDSRTLYWVEAEELRSLEAPALKLAEGEKAPEPTRQKIDIRLPRARPQGLLALTHARVLPMEGAEVIQDATIVIEGDRIRSIEAGGAAPAGATVRDLSGKTVIPGLIDVHAHLHYSAGDVLPEQEWRYLTALDFGVTTVHDPSASTDLVFTQAERVEAGLERGPRVYSTGYILYGALDNQNARTPDAESAKRHVQRLQRQGAVSVKVYQQSRRDQRQWYIKACQELGVVCAAEGGGDLWMNLNMVADGMTAIEHALPIAPLYEDVRRFMAASHTPSSLGSAYSPTLLVAYGGLSGEHWFYQHANPLNDARLLRHFPRRELDARAWRLPLMAQDSDWNHQEVARQAAKMAREGLLVTLGAHGQLQGLGVHWELWSLAGPGAMSPLEALRAGTIQGARYLGLESELGSLLPGKKADLIVLNSDPREDIRRSADIHLVIKNGAVEAE